MYIQLVGFFVLRYDKYIEYGKEMKAKWKF